MAKDNPLHNEAYELTNAASELRLHMEALRALFLLIERAYFEPRAEHFVKGLTVSHWEQIQLNIYTLTGLVDSVMKECSTVEDLTEHLYERTMHAQ